MMKDFSVYRFTKEHPTISSRVHYGFSPWHSICRRSLKGYEHEKMRMEQVPETEPDGCKVCRRYIDKSRQEKAIL